MAKSGANVRGLRQHNRALLLDEIRRTGGLSRIELAKVTGLTQQAVSKIVPDLLDAGFLDEERQPAQGVGKPRTRLTIRGEARYAIGVQLERDELRAVRTDLLGIVLARTSKRLRPGFTPAEAVTAIADCAHELHSGAEAGALLGLGVGAAGPLDHLTGVVHHATKMPGWDRVPLRADLSAKTALDVVVDKDTNAAAFAHGWLAGERSCATAVVFVGTGIGVGLLIDGEVYRGPRTNAGEFGHTTLDYAGPRCACGRQGCVEVLHNEAVLAGDPERAADLLGIGLVDLVQVLDLDRIVLAGRAVRAAPSLYTDAIRKRLEASLPLPHWQRIQLDLDEFGDDIVAAGAAAEVLAKFYADPG